MGAGINAPDIQDNHPRNHVDDSTRNDEGIDSKKNCIQYRLSFGRGLGEKKVEYGFPEQNEHDGDSDGRPEEIHFGIRHLDGIQCEQRIKQPRGEDPKSDNNDDLGSFF